MSTDSTHIKFINKWLKKHFGVSEDNRPWFRVVWAPTQIEKRHGKFSDFVPNTDILIRTVVETREVQKYNWVGPRWVMERLFIGQKIVELPFSEQGVYESLFIFQDAAMRPLEVNERACNLIAKASLGVPGVQREKRTAKDLAAEEAADHKRQQQEAKDFLDDEASYMSMQLRTGEAVSLANTGHKGSE